MNVRLLVSERYIYQNARCNDKKYRHVCSEGISARMCTSVLALSNLEKQTEIKF